MTEQDNIYDYKNIKDAVHPRAHYLEKTGYKSKVVFKRKPVEFLPIDVYDLYFPETASGALDTRSENYQRHNYKTIMHGVLRSGEKTTLVLENIKPYFEIGLLHASLLRKPDMLHFSH